MTKSNELNDIKLTDLKKPQKVSSVMYIRTTQDISNWMKENDISPTKLFNEAAQVIMNKK